MQVGWKSMRVLNCATIRCLEPASGEPASGDLRIMHGSAGVSSIFIFRRV